MYNKKCSNSPFWSKGYKTNNIISVFTSHVFYNHVGVVLANLRNHNSRISTRNYTKNR